MRIIPSRKANLKKKKRKNKNYIVKKSPLEEEEMRIIPSRKAHLANKDMKIMEEKPTSQRRNKKITLWRIIEQLFFAIFFENIMKYFGRIGFDKFTNGKFGGHLFSSKFMLNLLAVKVS